jgi:hypothetical protein
MPTESHQPEPFAVRDCALVVLATNFGAASLRELRDGLLLAEPACIYHHFWGRLLQPQFDEPEFNNDFASWTHHSLNDKIMAERLSVIDPADFETLEELRSELVDLIEIRLNERDPASWNHAQDPLHFTSSQIVVFDSHVAAQTPEELAQHLPGLSPGSIFYHFIDARARPPIGRDDFSVWLERWGGDYAELSAAVAALDPYFSSLERTKQRLCAVLGSPEVAE